MVPSFAGNINIGVIDTQKNRFNSQQRPGPAARPTTTSPPRNFNNLQNQNFRQQQQTRQQTRPQQFPQQQFQQQPQRQPQQQHPQRQPASPAPASNQQLSLFEQIKQRINREKQLKNQIVEKQIEKERQEQSFRQPEPQQNFRQPEPQQNFRQPEPQQNFRQPQPQQSFQPNFGSFGVFEAVDLSGPAPSPLPAPTPARNLGSRQAQNEDFFGVFAQVNLQ